MGVQVVFEQPKRRPKRPKGLKPCPLLDGNVWPDDMPTLALGSVWHQDCWERFRDGDRRDVMRRARKAAAKRAEKASHGRVG